MTQESYLRELREQCQQCITALQQFLAATAGDLTPEQGRQWDRLDSAYLQAWDVYTKTSIAVAYGCDQGYVKGYDQGYHQGYTLHRDEFFTPQHRKN